MKELNPPVQKNLKKTIFWHKDCYSNLGNIAKRDRAKARHEAAMFTGDANVAHLGTHVRLIFLMIETAVLSVGFQEESYTKLNSLRQERKCLNAHRN